MIILCRVFNVENDNNKYIITFLASLFVALIIFFANVIWDNYKRKKIIKDRSRNEIYVLCEKIIRYAIHTSQRDLVAKFVNAMHALNPDKDFNQTLYFKYLNDAESSSLSYTIYQADLIGKIGELEIYWKNNKEINQIKEAMMKDDDPLTKKFDAIFKSGMTKDEIESIYNRERVTIIESVKNNGCGRNLLKIQKIMYPNIST